MRSVFFLRCLGIISLLCPMWLHAQDEATEQPMWWQVDIAVFGHGQNAAYNYDETWAFVAPKWPPMQSLLETQVNMPFVPAQEDQAQAADSPYVVLDQNRSGLAAAAQKLERSRAHQLLFHGSVSFPKKADKAINTPHFRVHDQKRLRLVAREEAASFGQLDYWMSAPDLDPPVYSDRLDGWLRIEQDKHVMLHSNLMYLEPLTGISAINTDPDGRQEFYRDQVHAYRIRDKRKLRRDQTHYFDHPKFGLLVRLSETAAPRKAVPDNTTAQAPSDP